MTRILSLKSRFERHIVKGNGCWLWSGGLQAGGYGSFGLKEGKEWKTRKAHRISYQLYVGSIPNGLDVLHHCDNPPCVRPSHLFLGTDFDNQQDCKCKGRRASCVGEKNPNCKLTAEQVKDIRLFHPILSERKLSNHFGVGKAAIHKILHGRLWKDS
jgi:hypothetical protein